MKPRKPKIYHITHVENLRQIIVSGGLLSDAVLQKQGGPEQSIGMSSIKKRRNEELIVKCHPDTKVGEYVPFYFCPRSVMLYVIYRANNLELTYRGGQEPIIHLEADLYNVIRWAETHNIRWAFSLSNAGAYYTEFRADLSALSELDWDAIYAQDFSNPDVKERKQAEFLVYERLPFDLVDRIGVYNLKIRARAKRALFDFMYTPKIEVRRDWYF